MTQKQIDDFGRNYEYLLRLSDLSYQKQYATMSLGIRDHDPENISDLRAVRRIPNGKSKIVAMPLSIFGLFGQHRFWPSAFMNCVLEFTIQDPSLCCRSGTSSSGGVTTTYNSRLKKFTTFSTTTIIFNHYHNTFFISIRPSLV